MYNDLQLFIDSVEYFLDFDFNIKKAKLNNSGGFGGSKTKAEITLYNFASYNLSEFKILNNGITLFNGLVVGVRTYKDVNTKYVVFVLEEKTDAAAAETQNIFMEQLFFLKNESLNNYFTIDKKISLKRDVFFDADDSLEKKIDILLNNSDVKTYFFDKTKNIIYLKGEMQKNKLEIIDSSLNVNFKKNKNKGVEVSNEAVFRCKANIFLNPLDSLNFEGLSLWVIDVTFSGGSNSGVLMEVTANDLKLEGEDED